MAFNRFRISIIIRVLLLSATLFVFFLLAQRPEFLMLDILIGILIIIQVIALIHYVEKTNRDLNRFLKSIEFSDFSQSFKSANLGPSFSELHDAFQHVSSQFLKIRSEKEIRFRYFQTVVEHVASALISFKSDGEIEFMNKAAHRLLNIGAIRNISALKKVSPSLAETLLKLRSGEQILFKLDQKKHKFHLSIHATQFKLEDQLYTLVSMQNIQSELERERMTRELEIGQEVQKKLLPEIDFSIPGCDIAAYSIPASEVGGDYYDIIPLENDKLALIIGDVSGKGLPAAIYMTLTKGILQASLTDNLQPRDVLEKANRLIFRSMERGFFVSMFLGLLDLKTMQFAYARAGHNPVIFYQKSTDSIQLLNTAGIALGLENGAVFKQEIEQANVCLQEDDLIILYTDGINEAMDEYNHEFGDQKLIDLIKSNNQLSAGEVINMTKQQIFKHVGKADRHDDMTMVVLKISPQTNKE